jgi:hypothetical protein
MKEMMCSAEELFSAVPTTDMFPRFIFYRFFPSCLLLLSIGAGSCSDPSGELPAVRAALSDVRPLFPAFPGKFWEYRVDSVVYDKGPNGLKRDSSRSFIRYEVLDTLKTILGDTSLFVLRSWRPDDSSAWKMQDVLQIERTKARLEWQEGNLRFVKLVAPLNPGDNWNGNQYIPENTTVFIAGEPLQIFKNWLPYSLEKVSASESIGEFTYEDVFTILQTRAENLIEYRFSTEKYARGAGLVYREMAIFDTQILDPALEWEEKAEKGFSLKQFLLRSN